MAESVGRRITPTFYTSRGPARTLRRASRRLRLAARPASAATPTKERSPASAGSGASAHPRGLGSVFGLPGGGGAGLLVAQRWSQSAAQGCAQVREHAAGSAAKRHCESHWVAQSALHDALQSVGAQGTRHSSLQACVQPPVQLGMLVQ
jgi:hypothetical protein